MQVVNLETLNNNAQSFLEVIRDFDPFMYSIFNTQYLTGARFNDVYNLSNWAVKNDNTITLQPQKNNNLRVFNNNEVDELLVSQLKDNFNAYSLVSYSNCLLWFNRLFPMQNLKVKSKPVKTHIFRHIKAKQLKALGRSDVAIQNYLGEKSIYSAKSYIYSNIYQ